jgi:hypothetical protein
MGDHQVGADVGPGFEGLVDGLGVPDGVLERPVAIVVLLSCAALDAVLDKSYVAGPAGQSFRDERVTEAVVADQVAGKFWWTNKTCMSVSRVTCLVFVMEGVTEGKDGPREVCGSSRARPRLVPVKS